MLDVDVLRATQRKVNQARSHDLPRARVDDVEPSGDVVLEKRVERDRLVETEVADADLITPERFRGNVFPGGPVHPVLDVGDREADLPPSCKNAVGSPREQRFVLVPDDRRLELVGRAGRRIGGRDELAGRDFDQVGECQDHRLPRNGLLRIAPVREDAGDAAFPSRRLDANEIADMDGAAGDHTVCTATPGMGLLHRIDRQSKWHIAPRLHCHGRVLIVGLQGGETDVVVAHVGLWLRCSGLRWPRV
jgi:hypothetical protein